MTSSHHAPYILGYTHVLQCYGQRAANSRELANPINRGSVQIVRLQLAYVKEESLVIAGQHTAVNTFPGLVHTARHTMEVGHAEAVTPTLVEEDVEGGADDWGEVVTR